jgi:enamine deaminase RidA (YjgF/YER057c/UK114 family)
MPNQPINPNTLFRMPGFHQIVTSTGNRTIHIAGQGAYDSEMNLVGVGDYRAQTIKTFQNLALALESAGTTPADVVSSHMFVKGLCPKVTGQFIEAMNVALDGEPFPANASSLIGVEALADPEMLVEISALAILKDDK